MKRVLLVSTSEVFLSRNMQLLAGRGFEVRSAATGTDALRRQRENGFDLILSELELDDMDGCTLCQRVRQLDGSQQLPVILVCYDNGASIRKIERSGASAMLLKPLEPAQLLGVVGSFLDMNLSRSVRVAIIVTVVSITEHFEFVCISRDISNTGMLLETTQRLTLGSRIVCRFTLPDSIAIEASGEVVRCVSEPGEGSHYGVKFIALKPGFRLAIDEYVAVGNNGPPAGSPPDSEYAAVKGRRFTGLHQGADG